MNIVDQLKRDEGVRQVAYQDSLGLWTIGVGRLIDGRKVGAGLRMKEIEQMLANDIADREQALRLSLPWFDSLDEVRQAVLVNMAFQLGVVGLMQFKDTLNRVREGDYAGAAAAMLQSKWASQTPERAKRVSKQMETGAWQ
jgi:lysozyme